MSPLYPVYVISKGRSDVCLTAKFLIEDGTPFFIVVEPQEEEAYASRLGRERLLVLPFSNLGLGAVPARNWVWEHAKAAGHERHWILDDNIRYVSRRYRGIRFRCDSGSAFSAVEAFADRYENLAIAGLNYMMFVPDTAKVPPFVRNVHVYSCHLILNSLPFRWRGRYNDDTDLCLQVLAAGWCTVLTNAFLIQKLRTMTLRGGMGKMYHGDGRLKMARSLERVWPGVATTQRRFRRPQHVIKNAWRNFDTPLKRKPGIDFDALAPDEFGMKLRQVKETRSPELRKLIKSDTQARS